MTTPNPAAAPAAAAPAAPATPAAPPAAAAPATPPAPAAPAPTGLAAAGAEQPAAGTPAVPAAPAAPAEWKITPPEVFKGDALKGYTALAQELKLPADQAQKIADEFGKVRAAETKAQEDAFNAQDQAWSKEWQADPVLGGKNTEQTVNDLRLAFTHFDAHGPRDLLAKSGLGNNPGIIKLFAAIGKTLREDRIAGAGASGAATDNSEQARLRAAYPTMFKPEAPPA